MTKVNSCESISFARPKEMDERKGRPMFTPAKGRCLAFRGIFRASKTRFAQTLLACIEKCLRYSA